nr:MAG TPA: vacuolar ATP synthase subunit S1 [Caudoviricetes sp.]
MLAVAYLLTVVAAPAVLAYGVFMVTQAKVLKEFL